MSTPPPRVRTRKPPAQRSAEIFAAACALAREGGLSTLALRAVAQRAGVAPGLVAHYGSGMDNLVAAVFSELVANELVEVQTWVDTGTSSAQRLALLIDTVLGGDRDDLTLVWVDAWSLGRHNPALSVAIDTQMNAWHALLAEIITEGRRTGEFTTDDPDAIAWQLLGMLDGLSAHALARGTDSAPFIERLASAAELLVGAKPGAVTTQQAG
ncbi:TetR/AcrR family transcriptional regulator [Microterricola viridarii]|uniref:TetR family transcriptional regulator n=1 Tax=Microterricola viridarii TaxID=412690 RepID=A0A0Y0NF29_9MICO|nr:TetR family transcriptional regulator C-terminal domain-containing protein [Microterricola viridarii]AMB59851.1 TetR family transcriptional regulator [Microterricola viridarii]